MNRTLALLWSGTLLAVPAALRAQVSTNAPTGPFPEQRDNVSYSIGANIAQTIKGNLYELNTDVVVSGMRDALAGQPLKMTDDQMKATLTYYRQEVSNLRAKARAAENEARLAENKKWLEQNKQKEGVKTKEVTLADGTKAELQYKVVKEGGGAAPTASDVVTVNYRGTLIDGQEFDSSARHGKPGRIEVGKVIRGWTEGLQMMKTGSKYEFYIPSELAYGQTGSPTMIQPGAALILEVELLGINLPEPVTETPRPTATSDIIMVPSAEQLKAGSNVVIIKPEEAERMAREAQARAATNPPSTNR